MKSRMYVPVVSLTLIAAMGLSGMLQTVRADDTGLRYRGLLYLHYENSGGERGLSTFDYEEQGCPSVSVWEQLDKIRSSLGRFSYDDRGNLVRRYREFSDGLTSEELYEYDADNRLLKETFSRSDGVTGTAVHEYDADSRRTRTRCDKYKGWFDGELVYIWADGRKTGASINRDGQQIGTVQYDYDDAGKLHREHWQFGDTWSQTFVYEYQPAPPPGERRYTSANVFITFDDDFAVAEENYDYSNESGGPSYYGYDPGGKLVAKRFVRSDGLTTNTAFLYDSGKQLTKSYRVYADGRHGVFTYEFNDAGRLVGRKLRISDGNTGSERYRYDAGMKLTQADWENFDSWLTGTIEFQYADNHLSKGVFKGKNDFDAEITFGHDEQNHLTSIHWDFTFGGTQTYTFEYAAYDKLGPLPEMTAPRPAAMAAIDLPNTPAGTRAGEVIDLINNGEKSEIESYMEKNMIPDFLQTYSAEQQAGFWLGTRKTHPDMQPVYVKSSQDNQITVTVQSNTKLAFMDIAVSTEPSPQGRITAMGFGASGPPPGADSIDDPELLEKLKKLSDLPEGEKTPVVFVCAISDPQQLERAYGLAQSIRAFAGAYRDAPIWVFGPEELTTRNASAQRRFAELNVALKSVEIPEDAGWYFLSHMVFSAAEAEKQVSGKARVLVFMGSDTIVLQQPDEFILSDGVSMGYCPVMHKNINPLYSEPLDTYWNRAYSLMNIDKSTVFKMVTPADGDTIRPYFNAGCLAVRPERGLLGKWASTYLDLCRDSLLRQEAEQDQMKRIFTFQVALIGAVLNNLGRGEMIELSDHYNYPIFFKEMFGAQRDFHDITGVATMRYEHFFDNPLPEWDKILKGPPDRIDWIKANYIGQE